MDKNQRQPAGTALAPLKAIAAVVTVGGSSLGAFYVVATNFTFNDDSTVVLLWAFFAASAAAQISVFVTRRLFGLSGSTREFAVVGAIASALYAFPFLPLLLVPGTVRLTAGVIVGALLILLVVRLVNRRRIPRSQKLRLDPP